MTFRRCGTALPWPRSGVDPPSLPNRSGMPRDLSLPFPPTRAGSFRQRVREIAETRLRYGYRRITVLLRPCQRQASPLALSACCLTFDVSHAGERGFKQDISLLSSAFMAHARQRAVETQFLFVVEYGMLSHMTKPSAKADCEIPRHRPQPSKPTRTRTRSLLRAVVTKIGATPSDRAASRRTRPDPSELDQRWEV
jgi:hypothetical protein